MEVAKERVPDLKSRFLTPQPLASRLWPLFPVVVPLFHRRRPSASVSVKLVIPCVLFYFFQLYLKQRQRSRSKPPSPPPELPSTVELSPRLNRVLSRSLLSPRASSGPAHVSSRANSIAKQADSPYFVGLNRVSEDPFDELNNPDGFFQLGLAENKGGYRGFYSQNTIPLTPKVVNNIHKRGGTILGTSRGGHDTKKIVDCIQDRGINQFIRLAYLIGYGSDIERSPANSALLSMLPWPSIPSDASCEVLEKEKTVDNDLALKIYIKARATPKVVAAFAERR